MKVEKRSWIREHSSARKVEHWVWQREEPETTPRRFKWGSLEQQSFQEKFRGARQNKVGEESAELPTGSPGENIQCLFTAADNQDLLHLLTAYFDFSRSFSPTEIFILGAHDPTGFPRSLEIIKANFACGHGHFSGRKCVLSIQTQRACGPLSPPKTVRSPLPSPF